MYPRRLRHRALALQPPHHVLGPRSDPLSAHTRPPQNQQLMPIVETAWRQKAGTTEFHIHLWFDNGHDVFSSHEELEPTTTLKAAQAAAAEGIRRLQQRSSVQGITSTWWGDIQSGTWQPTEHDDGDDVILDAAWNTEHHPQWTSYLDEGQLRWEQLQ